MTQRLTATWATFLATALFAAPAGAAELVTNGTFSAGLTGFTSTYGTPGNAAQGSLFITANPNADCGCLVPIGDHTTGSGNMLGVDGAAGNTGAFWSQSFAVATGSAYLFSFWATNLGTAGPLPVLRASINGSDVISNAVLGYSTGSTATTWTQYTANFVSGAASAVTLNLYDDAQVYSYNDFAVDDISFTGPAAPVSAAAVPEPGTWAMMLAGFGMIGAALRRRTRPFANQKRRLALKPV